MWNSSNFINEYEFNKCHMACTHVRHFLASECLVWIFKQKRKSNTHLMVSSQFYQSSSFFTFFYYRGESISHRSREQCLSLIFVVFIFFFFYRGHKHIKSLIWYLFSFFGSALKSWSSDNKIMKGRKIISTYTCKDTSRFLKKLYFIECEVEKWFVV